VTIFFLYLSGEVICKSTAESTSVTIVAIKVINDSTKGNIGLVAAHNCACSKVPGTEIILEVAKTMMSMRILPINPAIIAPRELREMSAIVICFGPNAIVEEVLVCIFPVRVE
jgi:hypothetical protein